MDLWIYSKYIISIAKFSEILFKYNNYLDFNNQLFVQVHSRQVAESVSSS